MSYEMTGQNTGYPGPPPAPAPAVAVPPRSQFSKWWPISFFIAAIVFFIAGGGLLGAWSASAYNSCYRGDYTSCVSVGNDSEFYGGVACVVIGGICKLTAWILLIIYCVKRTRQPVVVAAYGYQPVAYPGPPVQPPAPMPYQPAPTPHPKEQAAMGTRYCNNCGAVVTAPFCSQCGLRA